MNKLTSRSFFCYLCEKEAAHGRACPDRKWTWLAILENQACLPSPNRAHAGKWRSLKHGTQFTAFGEQISLQVLSEKPMSGPQKSTHQEGPFHPRSAEISPTSCQSCEIQVACRIRPIERPPQNVSTGVYLFKDTPIGSNLLLLESTTTPTDIVHRVWLKRCC